MGRYALIAVVLLLATTALFPAMVYIGKKLRSYFVEQFKEEEQESEKDRE